MRKTEEIERRLVSKPKGIICDNTINFVGAYTTKKCSSALPRIEHRDTLTDKRYDSLANSFRLAARMTADICQACRDVKISFKRIKQNL